MGFESAGLPIQLLDETTDAECSNHSKSSVRPVHTALNRLYAQDGKTLCTLCTLCAHGRSSCQSCIVTQPQHRVHIPQLPNA